MKFLPLYPTLYHIVNKFLNKQINSDFDKSATVSLIIQIKLGKEIADLIKKVGKSGKKLEKQFIMRA